MLDDGEQLEVSPGLLENEVDLLSLKEPLREETAEEESKP